MRLGNRRCCQRSLSVTARLAFLSPWTGCDTEGVNLLFVGIKWEITPHHRRAQKEEGM